MHPLPLRGVNSAVLAAGVAAAALAGCSLVNDTEQVQCETAGDCAARGLPGACVDHVCVEAQGAGGQGGGDTRWGCLGDVTWPDPQPGVTVTLRVRLQMASAGEPIPDDTVVHFCSTLDVTCASPIAGPLTIEADGSIAVQIESGTRGYFQLGGPGIMPTVLYFSRPAQAEPLPVAELPVTIITPSLYQALISATGFEDNPERGTLLTVTIDCAGKPSAGVRLESPEDDEGATPFYFVGLNPSPNATQTDVSGFGGVLFMPTGTGTVSSYVAADDRLIGTSSFQIRPGTLTSVSIEPTPSQ